MHSHHTAYTNTNRGGTGRRVGTLERAEVEQAAGRLGKRLNEKELDAATAWGRNPACLLTPRVDLAY